jgi:hypothetical protein
MYVYHTEYSALPEPADFHLLRLLIYVSYLVDQTPAMEMTKDFKLIQLVCGREAKYQFYF